VVGFFISSTSPLLVLTYKMATRSQVGLDLNKCWKSAVDTRIIGIITLNILVAYSAVAG